MPSGAAKPAASVFLMMFRTAYTLISENFINALDFSAPGWQSACKRSGLICMDIHAVNAKAGGAFYISSLFISYHYRVLFPKGKFVK